MKSVHRPNEFGQDHQAPADEPPPAHTTPSRDRLSTLNQLRRRLIFLLRCTRNGHATTLKPCPELSPPIHDPSIKSEHLSLNQLRALLISILASLRNGRLKPRLNHEPLTLNPLANQLDWPLLLKQTTRFARKRIGRFSWRGEEGGILPGGCDANSIAVEAIAKFLKEQEIAGGDTNPESLAFSASPRLRVSASEDVRQALRRLVHRHIDRLRHRKENRLVRNEQDLPPVFTDDGEAISLWETIPAPDPNPLEALIQKEEVAELDSMKDQFISFLGQDLLLKELFTCLCAGISQRAALALKLNVAPQAVKNAQERLARRIAEFQHRKKS